MDKIKCILLPYAGASRLSYMPLVKHFPETIEPILTELPGHGSRIREALMFDMFEIAEDVYMQIEHELENKYVIYGHSMGAILGYMLIRLINKKNKPLPLKFIVSGRAGLIANEKNIYHDLPSLNFRDKLKELGGCPNEVLANDQLMDFFEPIIKADFKAIECFNTIFSKINVPITELHGIDDLSAKDQSPVWSDITLKETVSYDFPGNHFFIFTHCWQVVNTLVNDIGKHY